MRRQLFTIGHSNHPLDRFMALLAQHRIVALADMPNGKLHRHTLTEGGKMADVGVTYPGENLLFS